MHRRGPRRTVLEAASASSSSRRSLSREPLEWPHWHVGARTSGRRRPAAKSRERMGVQALARALVRLDRCRTTAAGPWPSPDPAKSTRPRGTLAQEACRHRPEATRTQVSERVPMAPLPQPRASRRAKPRAPAPTAGCRTGPQASRLDPLFLSCCAYSLEEIRERERGSVGVK